MFEWFRCRQRGCLLFKYNSTFDIADELWITQVSNEYPEADAYYHIPDGFNLTEEVYGDCCDEVGIGYSFQKWVRV